MGMLSVGLVSCTTTKPAVDNLKLQDQQQLSVPNSDLSSDQELSFEGKKELLTAKIKLADFSIRAIKDPKFVNALLSDDISLKEEKKCVFNNIDREAFYDLSSSMIEELVAKNPEHIDLYLGKLDLLISIADTFYSSPNAIEFDEKDLSASPALSLLPKKQASVFKEMIVDERYKDLLVSVGQPVKEDGSIFNSATMKFFLLGAFVGDSERKCKSDKAVTSTAGDVQVQKTLPSKNKIEMLAKKMKEADISLMLMDNKSYIDKLAVKAVSAKDKQCIFDNIDREKFHNHSDINIDYVVTSNPQFIDLYLKNLDVLISVADIFYRFPSQIEFDVENLPASPALAILPTEVKTEFIALMLDERYQKLLSGIGQPAIKNKEIIDYSSLKLDILSILVNESEKKCGLNT